MEQTDDDIGPHRLDLGISWDRVGRRSHSTQNGADASDELAETVWLGYVILRTQFEVEHNVGLGVERRYHNYRNRGDGAHSSTHFYPGDTRWEKVEEDEIGRMFDEPSQRHESV